MSSAEDACVNSKKGDKGMVFRLLLLAEAV